VVLSHMVRGYGPLDRFLAKQRYKVARKQIRLAEKNGRILDIGCGSYPLFLLNVDFREKYGLDKIIKASIQDRMKQKGIILISHDIEQPGRLPFEDDFFDVVSMLAVLEHIQPDKTPGVLKEIKRVLKPGGRLILTTPAAWTDRLLRFMAKLRLISAEEINEHQDAYTQSSIISCFEMAGFERGKITCGYFEFFMNIWVYVDK